MNARQLKVRFSCLTALLIAGIWILLAAVTVSTTVAEPVLQTQSDAMATISADAPKPPFDMPLK